MYALYKKRVFHQPNSLCLLTEFVAVFAYAESAMMVYICVCVYININGYAYVFGGGEMPQCLSKQETPQEEPD